MGSGVIFRRQWRRAAAGALVTILAGVLPASPQEADQGACVALLSAERDLEPLREAARQTLAAAALQSDPGAAAREVARRVLEATRDTDREPARLLCARLHPEPMPTSVLLTGYYRPLVPARRSPDAEFRHPLYALPPPELRRLPRAAIDAGALDGRVPAVAWLADPIEAFFIHIQGSAVLELPDGRMAVGYAGSNDRPYTSIGSVLVAAGRMRREDVSMESLKEFLRDYPTEREALLQTNERYIYFQSIRSEAIGSLGVPLTDGRSVAADPAVYPPGTLLLIRPQRAHPDLTSRLVFVQDRGSAITGPARLDLYIGTGDEAARIAGPLQEPVDVFVMRRR